MATDTRRLAEKLDRIDRIALADLPTPIRRLDRVSEELGRNIWIKRDDFTADLTALADALDKTKKQVANLVAEYGGFTITGETVTLSGGVSFTELKDADPEDTPFK